MNNTTATSDPNPEPATAGDVLQEYADNRGVLLRVDRQQGVIPGVKLLGTVSRKGRVYPKEVMARALPMYEGMRVNIDHVDPGQRRSLRDRIGLVKNVTLKEDGLYGDFHFNPKHSLAEQIAWDAENAPQNLGFSHDTRGVSKNMGGKTVVESIDKVLSVDLVANPATTTGLFEDDSETGRRGDAGHGDAGRGDPGYRVPRETRRSPVSLSPLSVSPLSPPSFPRTPLPAFSGRQASINSPSPPEGDMTQESSEMEMKDLTLDQLKKDRPDLVTSLQESAEQGDELKALKEELQTLKAEKATRVLQEIIAGELKAAGLDPANKTHCSEVFMEDLHGTADPIKRRAKIDDRKAIIGVPRTIVTPSTGSPLQEAHDGLMIPPANAPLTQRLARFAK